MSKKKHRRPDFAPLVTILGFSALLTTSGVLMFILGQGLLGSTLVGGALGLPSGVASLEFIYWLRG